MPTLKQSVKTWSVDGIARELISIGMKFQSDIYTREEKNEQRDTMVAELTRRINKKK